MILPTYRVATATRGKIKTYQSHGVEDLLKEDLYGLHALFGFQFVGAMLAQALSGLGCSQPARQIGLKLANNIVTLQAMRRPAQGLVGLARNVSGHGLVERRLVAHDGWGLLTMIDTDLQSVTKMGQKQTVRHWD